ncbi:hypothetical protein [Nocardioides lacusdianchii]|uniref:hypothetical protein n=1 Tax=Nocardioides lacusdianchii TaxID=2783664 RepID=UPI001CCADB8F|nr:hypothetical protein [Nocardioides lacusdianchii]
MPDVDTIVVVKATKLGAPQFIGSIGPDGSESADEFIVTPIDATVDSVHRGNAVVKDPIRLIVGGGKIGDVEFIAGPEVAPQRKDIAQYSRLLVAGKTVTLDGLGQVLDAYFVYGVNGEGQVKSLMESASGGVVNFSLSELQAQLGS